MAANIVMISTESIRLQGLLQRVSDTIFRNFVVSRDLFTDCLLPVQGHPANLACVHAEIFATVAIFIGIGGKTIPLVKNGNW